MRHFNSIFFIGITGYAPFELRYLANMKINILLKQFVSKTPLKPLNRISCNFYILSICIFTGNSEKILMGTNILFCASCVKTVKNVYMNLNDKEAVWICFWQWMSKCYTNLTIINWLCVSDYYQYSIMIFCSNAHN